MDSQWQNATQKNNDDLDWRTAGNPVLRGKSRCGSPVWSEEPGGHGYVLGGRGDYCVRDTAAAADRTQSGLSSFLFFLNVNWLKN